MTTQPAQKPVYVCEVVLTYKDDQDHEQVSIHEFESDTPNAIQSRLISAFRDYGDYLDEETGFNTLGQIAECIDDETLRCHGLARHDSGSIWQIVENWDTNISDVQMEDRP